MKHLLKFKLFEQDSIEYEEIIETINYVKDILLELEDMGFIVSVSPFRPTGINSGGISIVIHSEDPIYPYKPKPLLPIEIGQYLLSVDSYLREIGWVGFSRDDSYNITDDRSYVRASIKNNNNSYDSIVVKEITEFQKYLDYRSDIYGDKPLLKAPFHTVAIKYYKTLKTNESFNFDKIVSDLESILLEIDDLDYKTKIKEHKERVKPRLTSDTYYEVSISKPGTISKTGTINLNEVSDCIKRLISYIDSTNMFESKSAVATYKESGDLYVNQKVNLNDLDVDNKHHLKYEIYAIRLKFKVK